jgi:hypothetical protein
LVEQSQVAGSCEVGKAFDEIRIEFDPAGNADRGCRLDRHPLVWLRASG